MTTSGHPPVRSGTRALLTAVLVPIVVAAAVGLVTLWPGDDDVRLRGTGRQRDGTVTVLRTVPCEGTAPEAGIRCTVPEVRLTTGRSRGSHVTLPEVAGTSSGGLEVGDDVVVASTVDDADGDTFVLVARQRGPAYPLLTLTVVTLLVLVARWRGIRLLAGLAVAFGVAIVFAVPSILDGNDPVAVALTASVVAAVALVVLGHGVDARAATALVGVLVAVGVAALAGEAVLDAAEIAGLPDARPAYLDVGGGEVPVQGLLLAGLVLGAVGALVDVAIRQVDAAWDLRDADPDASWLALARGAIGQGRAHLVDVAASLALAYGGAGLPVLVLLTAGNDGVVDVVRGETLAVEVVRAAAGVGALVIAVPITAALAAFVVAREARSRRTADPRRFRSRRERELWEETDT